MYIAWRVVTVPTYSRAEPPMTVSIVNSNTIASRHAGHCGASLSEQKISHKVIRWRFSSVFSRSCTGPGSTISASVGLAQTRPNDAVFTVVLHEMTSFSWGPWCRHMTMWVINITTTSWSTTWRQQQRDLAISLERLARVHDSLPRTQQSNRGSSSQLIRSKRIRHEQCPSSRLHLLQQHAQQWEGGVYQAGCLRSVHETLSHWQTMARWITRATSNSRFVVRYALDHVVNRTFAWIKTVPWKSLKYKGLKLTIVRTCFVFCVVLHNYYDHACVLLSSKFLVVNEGISSSVTYSFQAAECGIHWLLCHWSSSQKQWRKHGGWKTECEWANVTI